jgi:hypothetical protein
MVILVYISAAALALLLLYFFTAHWYWHVLSVATGLGIGLVPPEMIPVPATWGATRDMIVGSAFIFLLMWGLCAPLFRHHHQTPHAKPHA